MTPFAALALYPLWAVALAVGLVALRLGRRTGRGLVALSFALASWVTGLVLLESRETAPIGERAVPFGMLLAGTFVHAALDVAGKRAPRLLVAAYGWSVVVAAIGLLAPRLLYGPHARGAGPLFAPIATVSAIATTACFVWMLRLAREAERRERRRRVALALANACGALGGGGVIALRVLGLGDVHVAAPLLLIAVILAAYAVFSGEHGRARDALVQGAVLAVLTAFFSAFGLVAFFTLLPRLAPSSSPIWLFFVVFFAALPLDPLRTLIVEGIGRRLFRTPFTVPDLSVAIETTETRAEHAERLAELGRVVSAVAHEVRNPLGVIAANAKLLERSGAPPEALEAIRGQIDRARRFLDDLLRYGKPRPLDVRPVHVASTVSLAVSSLRAAWGEDAPAVDVTVDDALEIEADRNAVTDVVTVLVQNALIASEGANEPVRVSAKSDGATVRLVVEDFGAGVPRELEPHLFEPFVTGRGRDARHPGTGLGLAIAARWIERHGGSIAHERPPRGARFVVRWPLRPNA